MTREQEARAEDLGDVRDARDVRETADSPPSAAPTSPGTSDETPRRGASGGVRLLVEMGPLVAFFVANSRGGIYLATKVFMVAILISLAASWFTERRLPVMPLVTAAFVLVFGGLTLYLEDDLFIKLKPTLVNALFGTTLLGGLVFGRSFLKPVFGPSFELSDRGWRVLTLRWGIFLLALAVLNEIVWRNFTTDQWVAFKTFGIVPLTIVFSMFQLPIINRHQAGEEA
jgi:intracellular septation protein